MKFLIIEDESGSRSTITRVIKEVEKELPKLGVLKESSFSIEYLATLRDIDNVIKKKDYDIIILDAMIDQPNDGLEVLRKLPNRDKLGETKVILFTATALDQKSILGAIQDGAFGYAAKPSTKNLKSEILRAIRMKENEKLRLMVGSFVDFRVREQLSNIEFSNSLYKGLQKKFCIMFCDLSNSSAYLRILGDNDDDRPKRAEFLRAFFTYCCGKIQENSGIVDKFIGDEVMAYFGGITNNNKDDKTICLCGLKAAIEIRNGFEEWFNKTLEELEITAKVKEKAKPNVKTILHFGNVYWAILGTENIADLTILTDNVIRTKRIFDHVDPVTKLKIARPTKIILTEPVYKQVQSENIEFSAKVELKEVRGIHEDEIVEVYYC